MYGYIRTQMVMMAVDAGSPQKKPHGPDTQSHTRVYTKYTCTDMCAYIYTHTVAATAAANLGGTPLRKSWMPSPAARTVGRCRAHAYGGPPEQLRSQRPHFAQRICPGNPGGHHAAADGDWRCLLGTIQNSSPERPCTPGCESEMHPLKAPLPPIHTY